MKDLKRIFSFQKDNYWEIKYYWMKEEVRKANKGIRRLEKRLRKLKDYKNIKEVKKPVICNECNIEMKEVMFDEPFESCPSLSDISIYNQANFTVENIYKCPKCFKTKLIKREEYE